MSMKGSNQDSNKADNKRLVLQILQREAVSRTSLAELTGLTKATITNIVNELKDENLVVETGSVDTHCGRKPVLIELNSKAYSVAGIYIARDFFHIVTTDFKGKIKTQHRHPINPGETSEQTIESIKKSLWTDIHSLDSPLLGIGITTVGALDPERQTVLEPSDFPGWVNVSITDIFEKEFNVPVFLENDCNASALAEKLLGSFKGEDQLVYLGVENGVGAGVIINGCLYKGNDGFGTEIGHITVNVNGERCSCGNIGCLELYLTLPRIVKRVRDQLGKVNNEASGGVDWDFILQSARNGDQACLSALKSMIPYLTAAVVNAANLYDPSVIILGHDLILGADLLLEPVKRSFSERFFSRKYKDIKICPSSFGNFSPVIGSIAIVLDNFFRNT